MQRPSHTVIRLPGNRPHFARSGSQAAWAPGGQIAGGAQRALVKGGESLGANMKLLSGDAPRRISGPSGDEGGEGAMDSTLRAATDTSGPEEEADV